MKNLIRSLFLLALATTSVFGQQVIEASQAQTDAGLLGAPYYVSPRRLFGSSAVVHGSGTATQVAFWSNATTLTSDADMTFATDTLTVTKVAAGFVNVTATTIPTNGIYLPSASTIGFSVGGVASLALDGGASPRLIRSLGGAYIQFTSNDAVNIGAAGTNQSITLTPSGSGSGVLSKSAGGTLFDFVGGAATDNYVQVYRSSATSNLGIDGTGGYIYTSGNHFRLRPGGTTAAVFIGTHTLLGGLTTDGTGVLQFAVHTANTGGISLGATQQIWTPGTSRLYIGFGGTEYIDFNANVSNIVIKPGGTTVGTFNSDGFNATWDKGVTFGSTALANIKVSANTTAGVLTFTAPSAGSFSFDKSVGITATLLQVAGNRFNWPSDGVLTLTNPAGTDFSRLQFGGTTSSFPALKRSTTEIQARLADDSGYAAFQVESFTLNNRLIAANAQALSGAGAVDVTHTITNFTSTGAAQALTLADGSDGQIKIICHVVDGGSGVLTPTTKTGFTTITFTNAGDSVTLKFTTTTGWFIIGIFGAVAA